MTSGGHLLTATRKGSRGRANHNHRAKSDVNQLEHALLRRKLIG